ncbi:Cyclic di-GMP phosphodiesterase response regulator RpfG [Enhygromyxa salina]|uniref:Cyclic di-GMP phosphodiesterase response regulator RpfG n=1 Tax=Enhygromyxa salina TaxID=215803 RepID=A0A2S9XGI0_9BACT|nr:HD domain-containing phosphohydrolase [Enhygromyxa salina]PRP91962.1 Cyclic di-GMP phosphodiesterase response regulator RpfG [Enhygromyxa salina]
MDAPATAPIGDFAGVLDRIEGNFEAIQIERIGPGSVRIHQRGAELAVLSPGAELPSGFDIALIVGAGDALAEALRRVRGDRVQLLPLPATAVVVDHAIRAGIGAARQRRRAELVDKLLDVGAALVAERDPSVLLELILGEARRITGADAGSIYVVEAPSREEGDSENSARAARPSKLRFRFAENASLPDARFDEFVVAINEGSVVGACVLGGEPITLRDCYGEDIEDRSCNGRSFPHDRSFDERLGYQTRSMLTVPMLPPDGDALGAIQLINARVNPHDTRPLRSDEDFNRRVVPFDADAERLCRALAAQGAVALENARLYEEIEALFEGFVRASVKAIEQRDPTTSGHSERVAALTIGLAEVVDRADDGPLAQVWFDRESLRELEYAALLHDFGKVGVREDVLIKAKKLYPGQRARVMSRFDHMRTAMRLHLLQSRLRGGPGREAETDAEFQARLAEILTDIDELQALVEAANEPSILTEDCSAGIRALERRSFADGDAREIRLLEPGDVESLLISRGSLTEAERKEIQSHVVHTFHFLEQIPWGRKLMRVPDIAGKHHEYLDGTGYPNGITAEEIPIQTRMMTIADIFDALTAADRPYKRAVPIERALAILEAEVAGGKLDRDLFEAFVGGRVYEKIELARP